MKILDSKFAASSMAAVLTVFSLTTLVAAQDVKFYREGGGWVEETTGSVPAGRSFRLSASQGSAQIHGQQGQTAVSYVIKKHIRRVSSEEAARREASAMTIRVSRGEMVTISSEGGRESRISAEYFITLPRTTEMVRVHTNGGSISANSIDGKVQAETAGGSISMADIGNAVDAETMGGSIDVSSAGGDAVLKTAGGSINIGTVNGRIVAETSGGSINVGQGKRGVNVETAGGSIAVRQCGNDLHATTAGGSLEIGDVGGAAVLETAGGSIRLTSAKGEVKASTAGGGIRLSKLMRGAIAETAAGPIEAEFVGGRNSLTNSSFETSMGDIVVWLPSDIAVTVKAAIDMANGHHIRSEFEGLRITNEGGQYGPREIYADGALNGGGPTLKMQTTSGNIELHKTSGNR